MNLTVHWVGKICNPSVWFISCRPWLFVNSGLQCANRDDGDPAIWCLLYKLIWGRWERQICRSVLMYSFSIAVPRRRAECLGSHVSLNVVVPNSFHACFWVWYSGQTTVSFGKSFCGVFVWALALLCVWFAVSLDETQVWLVDLRVVWLVCVLVVLSWFACISDLFGPCTNNVFTAYAHVRTEPQCDIGHTREKKKWFAMC